VKVQHLVSNFTGGELSPRLAGRTDVRKYAAGCRVLQNAIVTPHGGARKRPGSRFVLAQKNATDHVRLVEYIYSTEDSYILMFGPGYIWFFRNRGVVTNTAKNITGITAANPAVVTSAAHGFSNGDRVLIASVSGMAEVNNCHFVVAGAATNTFQLPGLNSSAFTAYASGGTASKIVELTTTYTADQLDALQLVSIRDVIYITHKDHPLRKISRFSNTSWVLSTPDITTGPFRTINGDSTNRIRAYTTHRVAITGINTGMTVTITAPGHDFTVGTYVLVTGVTAENSGVLDTGNPGGNNYGEGGAP
jgi:hypothetical protein